MPVFPRLITSEIPVIPSCVSWTGLEVSPGGFLEYGIIQTKISYQFLKSGVFLLQLLEPPSLVYSHTSVFFAQAVIGVVANPDLLADSGDGGSLVKQ